MTSRRRKQRRAVRHVRAIGDMIELGWRHRGNWAAIQKELDDELEWAKFRAKHGLVDIDPEQLDLDDVDEG